MKEVVFLIILHLSNTGGYWHHEYHRMPSWEQCIECLETARIEITHGGDAEASFVMYCAPNKPTYINMNKRADKDD